MKQVKCKKKKCLKEVNPNRHPGIFFGPGFVKRDQDLACVLCEQAKVTGKEKRQCGSGGQQE